MDFNDTRVCGLQQRQSKRHLLAGHFKHHYSSRASRLEQSPSRFRTARHVQQSRTTADQPQLNGWMDVRTKQTTIKQNNTTDPQTMHRRIACTQQPWLRQALAEKSRQRKATNIV